MAATKNYWADVFFTSRFYKAVSLSAILFFISFYFTPLFTFSVIVLVLVLAIMMFDFSRLFFTQRSVTARRKTNSRWSNGDGNEIILDIINEFSFKINGKVIDELPPQLNLRNWHRSFELNGGVQKKIRWNAVPHQRGLLHFGDIHVFVTSPIKLIQRRCTSDATQQISVYPAFLSMKNYQLKLRSALAHSYGTNPIQRIGQSMEFEQIKEYVSGEDMRTLNWKASARRGNLMVNNFREERSQQVYCIIDKGRLMKMPFDGLTLLDHAINSALALSQVTLKRHDKAGIITFSNTDVDVLAADGKPTQMARIMEMLYHQETGFLESDFELLYQQVRHSIKHRSVLFLFTNFESFAGLQRQINSLRSLAKFHLLVVIFFENTHLNKIATEEAGTIQKVYTKVVAQKFLADKRLIAKELARHGILSILTPPEKLTAATINKYLNIKSGRAL
ncbi:MAG: DUF58 domain-containing protein [Ginsengibacter sp.]